jgi:phospholipid transport system transporter-binding protein
VSAATLTPNGDGRWKLAGALDFGTVPGVWPSLERLLQAGAELEISLADVERTNSAGLVLLVEARDLARDKGCGLRLVDLPAELLDLARMSRCEGLISGAAA